MLALKTELETRWLLYQHTDDALFELYDAGWQQFYFGMDPTADSLHLGNFVNFMNAIHLMRRGNTCIPLVGGATGMIGDPGGKDAERNFLSEDVLAHNVASIQTQVAGIMDNIKAVTGEDLTVANVVNNADFYTEMTFLQFLRDVGKYMTVNSMMTRETVKKRIEDPDKSISYTEFSYMLIQGYDFVKLYEQGCKLQISGSDQWGNVTAGIELIRKKLWWEAYGLTCPLILDSSGRKFWKSEWNALWLDASKTSHYALYQYFLNVSDDDVSRFLRLFTLMSEAQISMTVTKHNQAPQDRMGQKTLAYHVVQIIRGTQAAQQAQQVTEFMFADSKVASLKDKDKKFMSSIVEQIGGVQAQDGDSIIDVVVSAWLAESRWEAKKLIQQSGISLNEVAVSDLWRVIEAIDWIGDVILLQKGKKNLRLVVR